MRGKAGTGPVGDGEDKRFLQRRAQIEPLAKLISGTKDLTERATPVYGGADHGFAVLEPGLIGVAPLRFEGESLDEAVVGQDVPGGAQIRAVLQQFAADRCAAC